MIIYCFLPAADHHDDADDYNENGWEMILVNWSSEMDAHMGPEGPSNFTKKLKGSVLAIFFFVVA